MAKLRDKKLILLGAIALLSATGSGFFTTAEINILFKIYGLLFTVQIGFLLFFVTPFLRRRLSSRAN